MACTAGMWAEPTRPWLTMRAVVGVMPVPEVEEMTHSASSVPSMMTSPRESSQQIAAWVVVFMVRRRAEVSSLPVWKLLRSSVLLIQMVWGCVGVEANMSRDSWMHARVG